MEQINIGSGMEIGNGNGIANWYYAFLKKLVLVME